MTLAEAREIVEGWDAAPPAFLSLARIEAMLAAAFGVKRRPPATAPTLAGDPGDLAALRAAIPGLDPGTTGRDVHAGLGGVAILDFNQLKARMRPHPLPGTGHG